MQDPMRDPQPSSIVPVLFGGDVLIYTWVRCFHERYGLTSQVYATTDAKMLSSSRFCDYHVEPGVDRSDVCLDLLRELGPKLRAEGKVGLVLGTGDWYARTFSEAKDELSQWFVVPYIDFPLLDEITQKGRFYELCDELDIPHPTTWSFGCEADAPAIDVDELSFPCIAKPSNSAMYHYAEFEGKKKVFTIETPEELLWLHDELKRSVYDRELLVQDLIPGPDDNLRTITCFSDAEGDVRVWSTGRVILEDHMPTAIGNPVCILLERNDAIAEQAARFLKRVRYRGFSNFDAKLDPRDGSYRFFEVNTRPGRNTYYMQIGGADIAELIVDEFVLGGGGAPADPGEPKVACDRGLFTVVPKLVVRRTVRDAEAREAALALFREGKAQNPLFNPEDTLSHNAWAHLMYLNHIRKFNRYVWKARG